MKLQFDSHQDFQLQAIQSVVDIFEGQPLSTGDYECSLQQSDSSLAFTENGVENAPKPSYAGVELLQVVTATVQLS